MKIKYQFCLALLFCFLMSATRMTGQQLQYIKVPELERILNIQEDKLFVVNFWATWCPPCVSELPSFEKVAKEYDSDKVHFILISLDFPTQIEKQLIPFLKKNSITLDVPVMMDLNYDSWIDIVDSAWQGNIPATLFFNNSKKIRHFHSGEVDEPDLRKLIETYL